jgi:signal transduction histidine kinase
MTSLTHELRTPLNCIIGNNTLIEYSQNDSQNEINHYVVQSTNSAHLLLSLVDDLLDYSRFKNHKLIVNMEPTDSISIGRFVTEVLQFQASQKGI